MAASHSAFQSWALPQLSKLLPLDEDSLNQIITYTNTLSLENAAEHLKNLLGDSPAALEFISSFNTRRPVPLSERIEPSATPSSGNEASQSASEVPRRPARTKKNATQPFNKVPPQRQPEQRGEVTGGYMKKKGEDDYMASRPKPSSKKQPNLATTLALRTQPDTQEEANSTVGAASMSKFKADTSQKHVTGPGAHQSKLPPSAAGNLISDTPGSSRSGSPAPKTKTKVKMTGGIAMRGQSTVIDDLDSAIRSLEMQTNPGLASEQENARRRCNCMAQRHPLFTAAPNCLSCGKIVCAKEGLGPCTFCGKPLLSSAEIQAMVKVLREERGKEKMEANNASHKKAEVAKTPRAFSNVNTPLSSSAPSSDSESERLIAAKQHRDRLLKYQADNAKRTRIHDEAADFETPDAGLSQWATPQERALQLKKQQKILRDKQWNSRPEYEKRKVVMSIDVVGGKAVRRMAEVERPEEPSSDEDASSSLDAGNASRTESSFGRNPLLGSLIRPVIDIKGDGKGKGSEVSRKSTWRRVQDDDEDNEQWILDGGAHGGTKNQHVLGSDEPACG